ncbi:MAG TPA: aminoglycoside phosphotransferase family protein [Pyrinomonadaceae bacterium]|jgi:hygromycin-B 7''-O-kinase
MKLPRFEDFKADFANKIWLEAAKLVCRKHRVSFKRLARAAHGESIIFLADDRFVIKIYVPGKNGFEREKAALEIARTSLKIPEIVALGEIEGYKYLITTQLPGELMTRETWLKLESPEQISVLTQLAAGLRELHASDGAKIAFDWDKFIEHQAVTCFERQKACQVNEEVLGEIPPFLEENLKLLPAKPEMVFLHGDVHFGNLRLLNINGKWQISGLFDFADSLNGFREYEFLAVGLLMIQGQGSLQREFFRAFGYTDAEINEEMRRRLMLLTMFYECSDLRRYAIRLRPEAVDYSLLKLERAIWNFC